MARNVHDARRSIGAGLIVFNVWIIWEDECPRTVKQLITGAACPKPGGV